MFDQIGLASSQLELELFEFSLTRLGSITALWLLDVFQPPTSNHSSSTIRTLEHPKHLRKGKQIITTINLLFLRYIGHQNCLDFDGKHALSCRFSALYYSDYGSLRLDSPTSTQLTMSSMMLGWIFMFLCNSYMLYFSIHGSNHSPYKPYIWISTLKKAKWRITATNLLDLRKTKWRITATNLLDLRNVDHHNWLDFDDKPALLCGWVSAQFMALYEMQPTLDYPKSTLLTISIIPMAPLSQNTTIYY